MRDPKDTMVWCDLETTGLNPNEAALLEVGFIITNGLLEEISRASWVFGFTQFEWGKGIDDVVIEMHRKSGLWNECAASDSQGRNPRVIVPEIHAWLDEQGIDGGKHPLCGSSVHFDRAFLKAKMPALEERFSYRNIDISTIKELLLRWDDNLMGCAESPKREIHRALPDLEDTIALARAYKNYIFG